MDGIFGHPARVHSLQSNEQLLELARDKHAADPTVFDEFAPFFWEAEISSDRIDAYFTQMHESSLRNYADDAAVGVSFQNSHKHWELGFGRSLSGAFISDPPSVRAAFYTIPGLRLNEVSTDDLIRGVRAGIVKDVSIGFYGGRFICQVCGRDMFHDFDCMHIPGIEYSVEDGKGKRNQLAVAWVKEARLAEVSAVYDGATPGAAILKAQAESQSGRITEQQARLIEQRYRLHLPGKARSFTGVEIPKEEGRSMPPENPVVEADEGQENEAGRMLTAIEKALGNWGGSGSLSQRVGVTVQVAQEVERLRGQAKEQETEIARLKPLAEEGKQYRADLVSDALAEGVRAYGEGFDEPTYRSLLEAAPLSTVKRMRDDWGGIADKRFPGQRTTNDGHEPNPQERTASRLAYT